MLAGAMTASIRLEVAERVTLAGGSASGRGKPEPGGWALFMLPKLWLRPAAAAGVHRPMWITRTSALLQE